MSVIVQVVNTYQSILLIWGAGRKKREKYTNPVRSILDFCKQKSGPSHASNELSTACTPCFEAIWIVPPLPVHFRTARHKWVHLNENENPKPVQTLKIPPTGGPNDFIFTAGKRFEIVLFPATQSEKILVGSPMYRSQWCENPNLDANPNSERFGLDSDSDSDSKLEIQKPDLVFSPLSSLVWCKSTTIIEAGDTGTTCTLLFLEKAFWKIIN